MNKLFFCLIAASISYAGWATASTDNHFNSNTNKTQKVQQVKNKNHHKHRHHQVKRECIYDNFNKKHCGYHCVKSPFKVACASKPYENCVVNVFNKIRCGLNCYIDTFNKIHCDNDKTNKRN